MTKTLFRPSFVLLALLGFALACAEPALDGSDLEASIAAVRKGVDPSRREAFDSAVETVRSASRGEIEGTDSFSLDGLTAEAIFTEAERIDLRRELAWAEREVRAERRVVDARQYLDGLRVRGLRIHRQDERQVWASFEVENGLDAALDTAWLRIDVPTRGGGTVGGEEMVDFRPRLSSGERREVRIPVTSDADRALVVDPATPVETRFTLAERGGEIVAQEPSPEVLAEARRRLEEAERRRDEILAELGG